jgi:predicted RNA-binding protein with PUA-like domain
MAYWLMKSEPDVYGLDDLAAEKNATTRWDGIRNYQARNLLRDKVKVGDGVLFYHSRCSTPAVVGLAEVVREAYPDPLQFQPGDKYFDPKSSADAPRWVCVDIRLQRRLPRPVSLREIKAHPGLAEMVLVNNSRLSVQPVRAREWKTILKLAEQDA